MLLAHFRISGHILGLNFSDFTSVKAVALSKIYNPQPNAFRLFIPGLPAAAEQAGFCPVFPRHCRNEARPRSGNPTVADPAAAGRIEAGRRKAVEKAG